MERKQDGFVPLGDVVAGVELPDGRALTPAAPRARHHFTRLDQIDQLVDASEADADLGFMARLLALCSPCRALTPATGFSTSASTARTRWSCSQAVRPNCRTAPCLGCSWRGSAPKRYAPNSRELILGRSLADFMRSVGVYDDGGAVRRRLRDQMQRLFRSHVELSYEDAHGARFL